jgi:hypothetical protein
MHLYSGVSTYATSSGIATVAQGLTGTPSISVNQVGISSYLTVSGVSNFYNDVHFEYDTAILIGNNDELQFSIMVMIVILTTLLEII